MTSTSLQEKACPITLDALKANFRANDFSTYSSGFGDGEEGAERNEMFVMIRNHLRTAWCEQLRGLTGAEMQHFSEFSAIGCMEKSEGDFIAGTLVDILEDAYKTQCLLDMGLQTLQEPIEKELAQLAYSKGKPLDELTEEECAAVLDRLADQFLGKMMRLLLRTQEVENWVSFTKEMPAHEDFGSRFRGNQDKIDYARKWYHLRTKIGAILQLDEVVKDENADIETAMAAMDIQQRIEYDERYDQLISAFCESLDDDIDAQIVYMCDEGLTQAEMAQRLGFKTHSALTKRIQKIYKKCCAFLEEQPRE